MKFMHTVLTRMSGGLAVGDSGLGCCVPCLLGAINSLCLLILLSGTVDASQHDNLLSYQCTAKEDSLSLKEKEEKKRKEKKKSAGIIERVFDGALFHVIPQWLVSI